MAGRHGKIKRFVNLMSSNSSKGVQDLLIDGQVIEDWDIVDLRVGQCIVSLPQGAPFIFYPVMYKAKGKG
jgi:hypothetical protein